MSSPDARGNPCSSRSAAAHAAVEQALWRMMSFYDTPVADLDSASAHDPAWCFPHAMKAGFLWSLTEPSLHDTASAHLADAQALGNNATPREKAHLHALVQVQEGRWTAACRSWDELLLDHPRDALALQWAQSFDFFRGDSGGLRSRPARVLPEWDEDDPLYPHVLGHHAFGLEEANLYPQAEEAGRRALALDPGSPWAVHAVAHVMDMQGRFDEGAAWLRLHQPQWAAGNGFAAHLWWHKGLFRLEGMDLAGAQRLIDNHLSGANLLITLQRLDAASLLWRLHLLGQDVSTPCAALVADWDLSAPAAGYYAFNDVHVVMALLGSAEVAQAERWLARCAERAMTATDARRSNHAMAREVGLPLMRGLVAFARGDADTAAELLFPLRSVARGLGGSHAQRDLIDQTLLAAAAQGNRRSMGHALLNERCMAKPQTPLTRFWMDTLRDDGAARA